MRSWTIALLGGVVLFQQQASLPSHTLILALAGVALAALPFSLRFPPARLFLAVLAGFLWCDWHAAALLEQQLLPEQEGQDLQVSGWVASLPIVDAHRTRFLFDVEQSQVPNAATFPRHIYLSWYQEPPQLEPGAHLQLTLRLKRPWGTLNPGGFDYEQWLMREGVRATGYVHSGTIGRTGWRYPLQRLRATLYQRLLQLLDGEEGSGILLALAMGERQGISRDEWNVLAATGTSHLVAVSGLHVGIVAGLIFLLIRRLWSRCTVCTMHLPAPRAAAVAAFLAALLYAALAGFSVPTQRALVMTGLVLAAIGFKPRISPSHTLAVAMMVILLLDPLAVLGVGLWLSFGAVFLLLYAMQGRVATGHWWWRWGRVHWVAGLGLLPLLIFFFQQAPLSAPLANTIAVPWVGLVVVPLTLLGALLAPISMTLAGGLLHLASLALSLLWPLLQGLATWQPATALALPALWTLPLALLAILWLLAPRGWPARWAGVVLLLPMLLVRPAQPAPGEFWFTLLDVGQGLSAVILTHDHQLVFDTGLEFSTGNDSGSNTILPFLRHFGRSRIDTLVVSHGDSDHIGGMETLLSQARVGRLLTSAPRKMGLHPFELCRDGQQWQWDGVSFTMLHPDWTVEESHARRRGNNDSCVLRVAGASFSVLLTGDIEAPAEGELVEQDAARLHADLLVAPHHGSKTSSTSPFIAAVAPQLVLFPLGYRNRYHFPAAAIVARYEAAGLPMLDTAASGAITIRPGEQGITIDKYRVTQRRYWHSEPLH